MSIVLFRIVVHEKWIWRMIKNKIIYSFYWVRGMANLGSNIPGIMDERKGLIEQ